MLKTTVTNVLSNALGNIAGVVTEMGLSVPGTISDTADILRRELKETTIPTLKGNTNARGKPLKDSDTENIINELWIRDSEYQLENTDYSNLSDLLNNGKSEFKSMTKNAYKTERDNSSAALKAALLASSVVNTSINVVSDGAEALVKGEKMNLCNLFASPLTVGATVGSGLLIANIKNNVSSEEIAEIVNEITQDVKVNEEEKKQKLIEIFKYTERELLFKSIKDFIDDITLENNTTDKLLKEAETKAEEIEKKQKTKKNLTQTVSNILKGDHQLTYKQILSDLLRQEQFIGNTISALVEIDKHLTSFQKDNQAKQRAKLGTNLNTGITDIQKAIVTTHNTSLALKKKIMDITGNAILHRGVSQATQLCTKSAFNTSRNAFGRAFDTYINIEKNGGNKTKRRVKRNKKTRKIGKNKTKRR